MGLNPPSSPTTQAYRCCHPAVTTSVSPYFWVHGGASGASTVVAHQAADKDTDHPQASFYVEEVVLLFLFIHHTVNSSNKQLHGLDNHPFKHG
jgi:hypothetical protein